MMRAMLLALCACALPSTFAFVASMQSFSARGSARGVPQSKRSPDVACKLGPVDVSKERHIISINNFIFSLYDIVFPEEGQDTLPPHVTQEEVTKHFTSCATEFKTTRLIHKTNGDDANKAISAVVDEANSRKRKLIAEESVAEGAELVASAAQLTALCFSWAPGVNLGLEVTALAAFATATGLEFDAAKYENSVIDYIAKMNNEVVKQPGMETINTWQAAVSDNGAFYPRLQIALTLDLQRAIMQSIPTGIQLHKLGDVDAEGYKAYIKRVGGLIKDQDSRDIVDDCVRLLASIDDSTTPQEIKAAKIEISNKAKDLDGAARSIDIWMGTTSCILALKDASKFYKLHRQVAAAAEPPLDPINEEGDADPGLVGPEAEAAGQRWYKAGAKVGKAISGLGAAAGIAIAGFQIKETVDLDEKLTTNINTIKDELTNYYENIIKNAPGA